MQPGNYALEVMPDLRKIILEKYTKKDTPALFLLNPGDTIFIPEKKSFPLAQTVQFGVLYEGLRFVLIGGTHIFIYRLARWFIFLKFDFGDIK